MSLANFLEQHMLTCPSRKWLHMDCPGCGIQRSGIALLKGEFRESITLHPATMPMLLLFAYAILHLTFRFKRGATVIITLQIVVAIVTVLFYIYKIVNHKIFY